MLKDNPRAEYLPAKHGSSLNTAKKPGHPEDDLQMACVKWFDLQYPRHKFLLQSNLNNAKNKRQQGIEKRKGTRAGRNDLSLEALNTVFRFELKTPRGSQSPMQREYQRFCESQGMHYAVIKSLDAFMAAVQPIMSEHIARHPKP